MYYAYDTVIPSIELKTNFDVNDFHDLAFIGMAFDLAEKVVLTDQLFRLVQYNSVGSINLSRLIASNPFSLISEKELINFKDFLEEQGLEFNKIKINSLSVNSPLRIDLATSLAVISIAWSVLATDYEVMGRNAKFLLSSMHNVVDQSTYNLLDGSDKTLKEIQRLLETYHGDILKLRADIARKKKIFNKK